MYYRPTLTKVSRATTTGQQHSLTNLLIVKREYKKAIESGDTREAERMKMFHEIIMKDIKENRRKGVFKK